MATECLRLQVSPEGQVWFGDDREVAVNSRLSPEAFVAGERFHDAKLVRFLGRADNAVLVEAVHQHKARLDPTQRLSLPKVQIGSPQMALGKRPGDVLPGLWHACVSSDVFASWYELADADYVVYSLVAAVRANGGRPDDKARRIMYYHPAWPAMSFTPAYDIDACCVTLATIVDVRWFTHPAKPHRPSKLWTYLGLTPENARAVCGGKQYGGHHYDRARTAMRAWLGFDPLVSHMLEGSLAESGPAFLRRICATTEERSKGLLLATRKYVQFFRDVWAAERSQGRQAFEPEMFFNTTDEVTAYRLHRQTLHTPAEGGPI